MFRILLILWCSMASIYGNVVTTPANERRLVVGEGEENPSDKILGGQDTTISTASYLVSIRKFGIHLCSGSIIDSQTIMTTAGCVVSTGPSQVTVQYGVTSIGGPKNVVQVKRIQIHKNFDSLTKDNDIALLTLTTPIKISADAKPVKLADTVPEDSSPAVLSGWGRTSEGGSLPTRLQRVDLKIVPKRVCQDQYGSRIISDEMLCAGDDAGGKGPCEGDTGGPLMVADKQVGIYSWSFGCARKNYAGVYTNVAKFKKWVMEEKETSDSGMDAENQEEVLMTTVKANN